MVALKAMFIQPNENGAKGTAAHLSLFSFMKRIISALRSEGKIRTSEASTSALTSFRQFRAGKDIMMDSINADIMRDFASWHYAKGNTPNTVSFYARILRAVYNRAVDMEMIEDKRPFRHVYTGIGKTRKRALPLVAIKSIKTIDLSASAELEFARDMFMFSFYLRGISFVDMALLKKSDLSRGYLVYRRRKTGQKMTIKWTAEMQTILNKYPSSTT